MELLWIILEACFFLSVMTKQNCTGQQIPLSTGYHRLYEFLQTPIKYGVGCFLITAYTWSKLIKQISIPSSNLYIVQSTNS